MLRGGLRGGAWGLRVLLLPAGGPLAGAPTPGTLDAAPGRARGLGGYQSGGARPGGGGSDPQATAARTPSRDPRA
jgi:hypothetical protein